ncbi:MAG: hypothetical protein ABSF52_13120 [Syntrophobacteraceae bacterium]
MAEHNAVPIWATVKHRRLRVLFVTPWYPSEDHQYAGIFVREYAKAVQLNHDITVLHIQPDTGITGYRSKRFWDLVREDKEDLSEGIPTYRQDSSSGMGHLSFFYWPCSLEYSVWHDCTDASTLFMLTFI